ELIVGGLWVGSVNKPSRGLTMQQKISRPRRGLSIVSEDVCTSSPLSLDGKRGGGEGEKAHVLPLSRKERGLMCPAGSQVNSITLVLGLSACRYDRRVRALSRSSAFPTLAGNSAVADVLAVETAAPADLRCQAVSRLLCLGNAGADGGGAEHTAA